MMNDIKRYVPILYTEGKSAACGVITDNLFITDAHAISPSLYYYIEFDGKRKFLNKNNVLYFRDDEYEPYGFDLAVYRLHDVYSPLSLATALPEVGKTLSIPYYDIQNSKFDINTAITIDSREGNYFGVHTSSILGVGNSGSPIIVGNKIYGLLNAGKPGDSLCAYLSSISILEQIKDFI